MGPKGERDIRNREAAKRFYRNQRDRADATAVIDHWNARLAQKREPWFSPTVGAALVSGRHWLKIVCDSCNLLCDVDLRVKRRAHDMPISAVVLSIPCPRCNGHGRPRPLRLAGTF